MWNEQKNKSKSLVWLNSCLGTAHHIWKAWKVYGVTLLVTSITRKFDII
jgi:hypothetical protein